MKIKFHSEKQRDPGSENGIKVPYGPGRKKLPRVRWWLILLAVFSPLIYFVWTLVRDVALIEVPGNIAFPSQTYRASTGGVVEVLFVEASDRVMADQPLVQLSDQNLNREIRQLLVEQNSLNTWIDQRFVQDRTSTVTDYQYEQAIRSFNNQKSYLDTITRLLEIGAATRTELLAAERALLEAEQRVAVLQERQQADVRQSLVEARQDAEQAFGNSQRLALLSERLRGLYDQRSELLVESQSAGQILNVSVVEGEVVGPGTLLLEIGNRDQIEVRVYIPTEHIAYANLGQEGTVSLANDASFRARIVRLPQTAARVPSEFSGPFGERPSGIMATMEPLEPIAEQWAVNGLPVSVRLDRHWSVMR